MTIHLTTAALSSAECFAMAGSPLTTGEFALLMALAEKTNSKHGQWWGSFRRLASSLGWHPATAYRNRDRLVTRGLMEELGREPGRAARFQLLPALYEMDRQVDEHQDAESQIADTPPGQYADGVAHIAHSPRRIARREHEGNTNQHERELLPNGAPRGRNGDEADRLVALIAERHRLGDS